jgi:hypothetical protein
VVSLNRRRFLALAATSTATALAGCSGSRSDPSYAEWIPASDGRILTAYLDLTLTEKTSNIDPILPLVVPPTDEPEPGELVPDLSSLDRIEDPLLRFPLQTGGRIAGLSTLSLAFAGLGDLIDLENPTRGVTELFVANDTVIGTGDIDVSNADEALRSGTSGPFGENEFEVVGEGDGYTHYEPTADISGAVAVGESAVLVADTGAAVRTAIDAKNGSHGRAVEENDVFDWLFDTAGTGDVAVGWIGPIQLGEFYWGSQDPTLPTDIVSRQDSVAASVTFSPGSGEATAEFALRRDGLARARVDRMEGQLGTSSDDTSLSVENDRMSATGTYAEDALAIDFVESRETTPTTTVPRGEDVPPEVADAVPGNAFEFVYKEDVNRVKVNFLKEFEADSVTVRATESEFETSSSTPGPITYLTVSVAPEGDEVVVIVTVDGESGVVAREEVP